VVSFPSTVMVFWTTSVVPGCTDKETFPELLMEEVWLLEEDRVGEGVEDVDWGVELEEPGLDWVVELDAGGVVVAELEVGEDEDAEEVEDCGDEEVLELPPVVEIAVDDDDEPPPKADVSPPTSDPSSPPSCLICCLATASSCRPKMGVSNQLA
jgi:hypothetical protein